MRRLPRPVEDALTGLGRSVSEVFANALASAMDDALERVESKFQNGLARIKHARGVAQRRGRRGRRS